MKKVILGMLSIVIFFVIIGIGINKYVIVSTKKQIIDKENIDYNDIDCILVLGASIKNNYPSKMLEDRLLTSIELYNNNISEKILVSGDHENDDYDEVNVMKQYLIDNDIPSKQIFMDHLGISTYDSIYRTKEIFNANKIIIVTQDYHLYRSLYIANQLDIDAIGVSANKQEYYGQRKRDIREIAARIKDFFKCIIKPQSKYLGEVFPINGNGDKTNNKR